MHGIVAYDLSTWRGFLLPLVVPTLKRLRARPTETSAELFQRLRRIPTTTFLFHVDLTDSSRCPPNRRQLCEGLMQRGWRVLNGDVTDISKRFVQAACSRAGLKVTAASAEGDPDELVIVKTNRNYGGKPEASISLAARALLRIRTEPVQGRADHGYVVCARRDVPRPVWRSPSLVVERYVNNRHNLFYRAYLLAGNVALSEAEEAAWVKTIGRAHRHRLAFFSMTPQGDLKDDLDPDLVPAAVAIARFVSTVRLDYGCLDLLRDESGNFYIVDVNPTPHWGREDEWRIPSFLRQRWKECRQGPSGPVFLLGRNAK